MRFLIETEALPRPIRLRLPTGLLCSSTAEALLNKALQKAQETDSDDDGTAVTLSEDEVRAVAAAEEERSLPWRNIMRCLRAFAKEHPDFTLCEVWTDGTHVKIQL